MWGILRKKNAQASSSAVYEPAPATYAQWSACLDALAKQDNDEACLQQLQLGQLAWTGGVAPMFGKRVSEEIERRLSTCSERMARDFKLSTHETMIIHAILQARGQLNFLHRLCQLPVLPGATQEHLMHEIQKFAERAQNSLEDTAKADRSGKLTSLLRHTPLTRYTDLAAVATPTAAIQAAGSASAVRKRNILL